jgi:predicted TIM-barrel fold metal-dependent hydrolase
VFADWKHSVIELAKCQNVTMKLGGLMKRLAAGCSADEKAAIFAGTARQVYRPAC